MRSCLALLSSLAVALGTGAVTAQDAAPAAPEFIGQIVLPTGLKIEGVEFGGISGIDYDEANDLFYAISDDRSQRAPARFYTLKLVFAEDQLTGLDIVSTHTLTGEDGEPFAEGGVDPEAIRFDAEGQRLFWSSEGDAEGRPAVHEADLTGKTVRSFEIPDAYLPDGAETNGIFGNLAFESLTLSGDGRELLAGTENALAQDGAKATLEAGSPSRIIVFDTESGAVSAEYIYETDPIAVEATEEPGYNDNGLSEFLMLSGGRLLTVERSFGSGVGNTIAFYVTSLEGATDIAGMESIEGQEVQSATKTHWFTIAEGDFGLDIDNIESVSFGPQVGGRPTLVIASDNNFNPVGQFTQFVVFSVPEL
ncbi:hypothetical protein VE25_04895 [Devosia geojensis]|uniref:Phytase-like domain-containing protein n=1 Tax=Devosia geojensis TaxID=443610 RepID=A0A0F5FWE3_9HYPH|nr:esterase-like activity of phytase family protein [Devosia geojensis]KKB12895.1 hypothetical protein VE25_04895 [Devosia geojensis]